MNSEIKEYNEFQYKHKPRNESTLWRYKENGKYISGAIDPDYKNKYYALKYKEPVKCPLCGSMIVKLQMNRHKANKKCISIQIV